MAASGHSDAGPARFVFGPGRAWDDDARLADAAVARVVVLGDIHVRTPPLLEAPTRGDADRLASNAAGGLDVLFCHDAPAGVRVLRSGLDYRPPAQIEAAASDVRALLRDVVDRAGPRLVFHGHWHHPNREHLAGTDTEVIGSTLTAGPAVPPSWTSQRSPPPSSTATSAATLTVDANTPRRRGRALPDRHAHSPVERPEGLRRGILRPEASTGTTGRPCSPRAPCGEQTRPPAALTALDRARNRDFPPDRRTSSLYNGPKSDLSQRRG